MNEELQLKWAECQKVILDNIGESRFNTWFAKTVALSLGADSVTLQVPSNFFVEKYEDDFLHLIHAALKKVFKRPLQIFYKVQVLSEVRDSSVMIGESNRSKVVGSKLERSQLASVGTAQKGQTTVIDSQLNPVNNFENYCAGHSNMLAMTIARTIAENPRNNNFNPFFLHGDVGVGKTHLIQAIGIRIKEQNPNAKVLYTTAREFQHLYSQAAIKKTIPQFINWFMQMDALLMDDLQEIAGKVGTIEALFPIFNHLHQNGKQLVFTCDRRPADLDGFTDRMIDRFKWGLTEHLPRPDAELRKKILKFKAVKNGLDISDDVIGYISEHAVNSVREIEGIVMGVMTRAITSNAPITVELAKEVMKNTVNIIEKKPVNFEMIVESVAEYFHLNPDAIFSKNRMRDVNDARQVIMYLGHKLTGLSSTVIGRKLNRQHGTVLHGIAAVRDRLPIMPDLAKAVETIEADLA